VPDDRKKEIRVVELDSARELRSDEATLLASSLSAYMAKAGAPILALEQDGSVTTTRQGEGLEETDGLAEAVNLFRQVEPYSGVASLFNADAQAVIDFEDRKDWLVASAEKIVYLGHVAKNASGENQDLVE
jgi:hypothetical protein